MKTLVFILMAFYFSGAVASTDIKVTGVSASNKSSNDAFDVSLHDLSVMSSVLHPAGFDASDAFGGVIGMFFPSEVIFQDNGLPGQTDFLAVASRNALAISGIRLSTYDDSYNPGSSNRGIGQFRLLAGDDPGSLIQIFSAALSGNFKQSYGSAGIELTATFDEVVATHFRFEFLRINSTGPRIVEIDAITAVPEPSAQSMLIVGVCVVSILACKTSRTPKNRGAVSGAGE